MDQQFNEIVPLSSEAVRAARPVGDDAFGSIVYPDVSMSRGAAVVDLVALLGFIAAFGILSSYLGVAERLQGRWPEGGRFLWVPMNGVFCLLVAAVLIRRRGQTAAGIGLGRARLGRVVGLTAAAVPLCFLAGMISNALFILASGKGFMGFARERGEFVEVVAAIPLVWVVPLSIFVGIYEEVLFRGFLISRIQVLTRSRAVPVIVSSLIFGALHFTQGKPGMLQTALVGIVLGTVAVRARSIWPCILAHTAVDTIGLLLAVFCNEDLQRALRTMTSQGSGG